MSRWWNNIGTQARIWWVACILLWSHPLQAASLQSLETRYKVERQSLQVYRQQRQTLKAQAHKVGQRLSQLKREASRGFLGIAARLRLPSVRAKAQKLAMRLEALDRQIRGQQRKAQKLNVKLQRRYRSQFSRLRKVFLAKSTSKARRSETRKAMRSIKRRFLVLVRQMSKRKGGHILVWQVELDPLDGPRELKQKADTLKDIEDQMRRRLKKLHSRIHKIKKHLDRSRRDKRLANRVNDMMEDDLLFDEQGSNPRVVVGGNKPKTDAERKQNTPTVQSGGTKQESAAPPRAGLSNSNSKQAPTARDDASFAAGGAGAGSTRRDLQPKIGMLPRPVMPGSAGDPMNPAGTADQKLRALKKYQQKLMKQLKQLKQKQKRFMKRARKLKKEEKRQRSR